MISFWRYLACGASLALGALGAAGCTANVDTAGDGGSSNSTVTACTKTCDNNEVTCTGMCSDDTCKASCTTTHNNCVTQCSSTTVTTTTTTTTDGG